MLATWAISVRLRQSLEILRSLFHGDLDRLIDAPLQIHRIHAGGDTLHPLIDDRLRQNGPRSSCHRRPHRKFWKRPPSGFAPPYSPTLSSNSISLATETPSLVIVGAPNERSRMTFLPFGPKVTLTASATRFDPAQNAAAGLFGKFNVLLLPLFYSFVVCSLFKNGP